jgi:hypothetical protein
VSADENKALVHRYFEAMSSGDSMLPDLLADDVSWWVPPSSPLGGLHEGKAAVLQLMAGGIDLYDNTTPMRIQIDAMIAEGDWVAVQATMDARTAKGEDYHNYYHFAFRVEAGKIREVKEHVDTFYAHQKLFA